MLLNGDGGCRGNSLIIFVETFPALLAQPAGVHHLGQEDGGAVFGVAGFAVQDTHDAQARIQPDEVRQGQWSHGHGTSILHDPINALLVPHPGLQADDGLVDVGHENAVGNEPRAILGYRHNLAHTLTKVPRPFDCLLRGLQADNDLHPFLHGNGVHKVRGNHP